MKNRVLVSLEDDTGDRCVDIFERPDASIGFEEFRRDAEDSHGWRSLGRYSNLTFSTESAALDAARSVVHWVAARPAAPD